MSGAVGTCARACDDSGSCADGYVCSPLRPGVTACLATCDAATYDVPNYVCADGVQTPCYLAQAGDAPCTRCCDEATAACSLCEPGDYCAARSTGTCQAPQSFGGACVYARECESENCAQDQSGGPLGRCLVEQAGPCDGDDCSRCIQIRDGWTYCHRECDRVTAPCPGDYPHCVGSAADDTFWCHSTPAGLFRECDAGHTAARITSYQGTIDVCVPRTAAFVCGSASVGDPCE